MHGGGVTLARRFSGRPRDVDLILATDMLDLTTFLSLTRATTHKTPAVLYMHENQLTYPLPEDPMIGPMRRQKGERDLHYAFVNFASMLAADRIVFNSSYHREDLMAALPKYLKHFPDHTESNSADVLARKSVVLPVGIHFRKLRAEGLIIGTQEVPLIIWNQRWEYDKNPDRFFRVLMDVKKAGLPFRLALCGEVFEQRPIGFEVAMETLNEQLIHVGYAEEERYHNLLRESDIIISTASHEFFGVSVVEAVACKTFPILPNALSYPEIIPAEFHPMCLYQNYDDLLRKVCWALRHRSEASESASALSATMIRFDWAEVASQYDACFAHLLKNSSS